MPEYLVYFGTYTDRRGRGIYLSRLDDYGVLSEPKLVAETGNPTWITHSRDKRTLYAVSQAPGMAVSFAVSPEGGLRALQEPQPPAGRAPCHLALDKTGGVLFACNYHAAVLGALPVREDGALGEPRIVRHQGHGVDPVRQATAHVHSCTVSPDNRFAIVCDLGLDRIFTYRIDTLAVALTPASPPSLVVAPGSGPRHFAFGPSGLKAYAVTELSNTVLAFDYLPETGGLKPFQTISTLPEGFGGKSTAAEIRLSHDGRFLYVSNRGHDSLAQFSIDRSGGLTLVEIVPCGGKGPRHFNLSPDARFLICAHQDSDSACVFRVDGPTGRLERLQPSISLPEPVCVLPLQL